MTTAPELVATITASNRSSMEVNLNAAVESAEQRARSEGYRGILVTRVDDACFTVELSPDVPYGYTYEKRGYDDKKFATKRETSSK